VAYYVDTSAAAKLVFEEEHSSAMREWIGVHGSNAVSSDLLRTELLRVARRGSHDRPGLARAVLDRMVLMSMPAATFERAADIDPEALRSLDALHLAAALELGDALDGLVTYDQRMGAAALARGVHVVMPGV